MSRSKYGNRKTERDGIVFDSKAEARRYDELKLLERSGAISDLTLQPTFVLQPSFKRGKRTIRAITYVADFQYAENGKIVAEDCKGAKTEVFRIKAKMFEYVYPEIELRVVAA